MTSSSSKEETRWASILSIKELKELSNTVPGGKHCVERTDLEALVENHYPSLEKAQSYLRSNETTVLSRLKSVLSQDRGVLNFEHYSPSAEHVARMKRLGATAPELYNNPNISPRSKWFHHPRYHQNSQMPPYHVHFREEMQNTLRYLYDALRVAPGSSTPYTGNSGNDDKYSHQEQQYRSLQNASNYFRGCMRGLKGHVQIEEYACFPLYEQTFPDISMQFLYQDHKDLHETEQAVHNAFHKALIKFSNSSSGDVIIPREEILELIGVVLDFDSHLMSHLGEEEEVVVPLSLTDKQICF